MPVPGAATGEAPWSLAAVRPGDTAELLLYGDTITGTVTTVGPDHVAVRPPEGSAGPALRLSTTYGTATFAVPGGAVSVPVSVRAAGLTLRVQLIGEPVRTQRREHPRAEVELPVTLAWLPAQVGAWQSAVSHTVDISRGGMRVAPAKVVWPSAGTRVLVSIDLGEPLQLEAEVVGKTPDYGLRLRFSELDPAVAARVDTLAG